MRQTLTHRIPYIFFFLLICSLALPAQAQQVGASWNGGTGNWSVPTNWNPVGVPTNTYPPTYSVTIAAPGSVVTVDLGVRIDNFTLAPTNALNINAGAALNLTAPIFPGNTSHSYGTLINHGGLSSDGTITNSGTLMNAAGATIRLGSPPQGGSLSNESLLLNSGAIILFEGSLSNSGTLINSGTLNVDDIFSSARNSGMFLNSGMMGLSSGARMDNTGSFTNSGVLGISRNVFPIPNLFNNTGSFTNSGTVTIFGALGSLPPPPFPPDQPGRFTTATNYIQTGGKTIVDGILTATGDAIVNIQGGTLAGRGVINGDVRMGGTLMPGDSPGTLTIFGNYQQTGAGILDIILGSLAQSALDVHGNVFLDPGSFLQITLLDGFNPYGRTFEIMRYDTLTGTFSNGLDFWDDNYLWQMSYGQNALSVTAVGVPEPGSFHLLGIGLLALAGLGVVRKLNSTIIIPRM
jgi:hypothetical protein